MKRSHLLLVFAVAAGLYLPTMRFGFVQDDLAIVANNPAVRSLPAALQAFDDPYWPRQTGAGLYRPATIASYAVDWAISGGRPGWFHVMNALWHGLVTVLVTLLLARWLPGAGALAAGLVFAVHPVHVEGVASVVARAELLVAAGTLGAVLCARRGWWIGAVLAATVAMFSKEHGVIAGLLVFLDDRLAQPRDRAYPVSLYGAMAAMTVVYLFGWWQIGRVAASDVAPAFYGTGIAQRWAIALPALTRAVTVLVWPYDLVADYGPQVIPTRTGFSFAALAGVVAVGAAAALVVWSWRRVPMLAFATIAAALAYLPTSNLLFPSGIVMAERTLYLPVVLAAAGVGLGATWLETRWGGPRARVAVGLVVLLLGARSLLRMPAWESNRTFLLTTLSEHPESYRAHVWAAAVFAGLGDSAGARREYARADSLFDRDPRLDAEYALFLMTIGDSSGAIPRLHRARQGAPATVARLKADMLLAVARSDLLRAKSLGDSVIAVTPGEEPFVRRALQKAGPNRSERVR